MTGEVIVVPGSVDQTIRRLSRLPATVGRRALRTGVFKAGSETLKQARAAAPVGRTRGQFKRSLAKKDTRNAKEGEYISEVGQNRRRRSTVRQFKAAKGRGGKISRGLSGRGLQPPINWIESGVKPHTIRPKRRRRLAWNIVKGNRMVNIRTARVVRHPGHKGTGFLARTERRFRRRRVYVVKREVQLAVIKEARRVG